KQKLSRRYLADGPFFIGRQNQSESDSGQIEPLPVTVQTSDTRTVAAFPDGKEIAVLGYVGARSEGRRVFALDLASKRTRDLSPSKQFAAHRGTGFDSYLAEAISPTPDGQSVIVQWNEDDNKMLATLPRDGSQRIRTLMQSPAGATPLSFD